MLITPFHNVIHSFEGDFLTTLFGQHFLHETFHKLIYIYNFYRCFYGILLVTQMDGENEQMEDSSLQSIKPSAMLLLLSQS